MVHCIFTTQNLFLDFAIENSLFLEREPPTLKVTDVLLSWYKFSIWLFYFLFFDRCMSEIKVFLVVFCIVIIRKHTLIYVFLFNAFTKNVRCT